MSDNKEKKKNIKDWKFNKFQHFYLESIIQDSSFPQIHRVKPIFEKITKDEFIAMIENIMKTNDHEMFQQFLYFLLLFRDMKHIQEYINSEEFSIELLERFVMFTYGYCTLHGHSTDRVIDEVLYFLNNERLLDLVNYSKVITRDKLLLFFILSKFDINLLNKYFAGIRDISEFINYFLRLPEEILRSIITRNYHLFQYIMLLMAEGEEAENVFENFYVKYKADIEQFSKLSDIVRKYKQKVDLDQEKSLPFNKRDMSRISFLVNMIRDLPEPEKAAQYFYSEDVFVDEQEKEIVIAIVTNPMFKNTFKYYDKMFDTD